MTTQANTARELFAAGKLGPGLCECGCGQPTHVAKRDCGQFGRVRRKPARFIQGHQSPRGEAHYAWRGGRTMRRGYVLVARPDHPRADKSGYVQEHIVIAEAALGRFLPAGAEVHHFDGDKAANANSNLVICQDHAYHMLLEMRQRALRACGHANWRSCCICHQYDDPANLRPRARGPRHAACIAVQARARRARLREACR